jgi:hypothetical protein
MSRSGARAKPSTASVTPTSSLVKIVAERLVERLERVGFVAMTNV